MISQDRFYEIIRYIINGLIATGVHYSVFMFNLNYLALSSAGLANFLASFFGISASFFGSRYFVFQNQRASFLSQFIKFSALYAAIAILSGLILFVWSDILNLNKSTGFLVGVALQVVLSYLGGRRLVFA